jgi:putative salt-induced outer membrane protein YdiY
MLRFRPSQRGIFPLISFLVLAHLTVSLHAQRRDLVVMKNGDQLSGELKRLENGILYFKPPYVSDSIQLDWLQVKSVQSSAVYQVVLKNGQHLVGAISKVSQDESPGTDFQLKEGTRDVRAAAQDVVDIQSEKQNFWRQLTGSIDFGYDFTSGNSQTSLNSDASANYLSRNWATGASLTSSFSGQSGGSESNMVELTGTGERYLGRNSSLLGLADFLHSSQQDLQLRTTLGGGYSRYLSRTNQNRLLWVAGTVYNRETFVSATSQPTDDNVEGLLGGQYQLMKFNLYNLQSQLFLFPGISDAGRIRATTKTTFTVKLSNNFYTNVTFWDNYDSRPPINAKKNQLGISSGLGWSF